MTPTRRSQVGRQLVLFRRVCTSMDSNCDGGCVLCTAADLFRFLNSVGFLKRCQSYELGNMRRGHSIIRRTVRFVSRGLGGGVDLSSVTHRMGLSTSCFSRLFRSGANSSPLGCVNLVHVRRTYQCLSFASVGVDRVDPLINFRSPFCFSHLFAGCVKVSPSRCEVGGGK